MCENRVDRWWRNSNKTLTTVESRGWVCGHFLHSTCNYYVCLKRFIKGQNETYKKPNTVLFTCSISLQGLLFWLSPGDTWGWWPILEWRVWLHPRNPWPGHWRRAKAAGNPRIHCPSPRLPFAMFKEQKDGLHLTSACLRLCKSCISTSKLRKHSLTLESRKSAKRDS